MAWKNPYPRGDKKGAWEVIPAGEPGSTLSNPGGNQEGMARDIPFSDVQEALRKAAKETEKEFQQNGGILGWIKR